MEDKLKEIVDRYDVKIIKLRNKTYRLLLVYDLYLREPALKYFKYFDGKTIQKAIDKAYKWYKEGE
jgi:hypothetical protein